MIPLILLALCWGPSFLLIKVGLDSFPPISMVFWRVLLGGLMLGTALDRRYWKEYFLVGFFANTFPFLLITYCQQSIPSSLGAILNATTPLFTIFLCHFFIASDRITLPKLSGILLGLAGIATIFGPTLANGLSFNIVSAIGIVISSISYAIGMVITKRLYLSRDTSLQKSLPAGQLLTSALTIAPFYIGSSPTLTFTPTGIGAMLALAFLGTTMAYRLYHYILIKRGASYLSYAILLAPLIGVALGSLILKEKLTLTSYLGCALILSGLLVANFIGSAKKARME